VKLFGRFPTCVITIPERHGRADGRTTCRSNSALCVASCSKNNWKLFYFCVSKRH